MIIDGLTLGSCWNLSLGVVCVVSSLGVRTMSCRSCLKHVLGEGTYFPLSSPVRNSSDKSAQMLPLSAALTLPGPSLIVPTS